jgi:hypothetical protein
MATVDMLKNSDDENAYLKILWLNKNLWSSENNFDMPDNFIKVIAEYSEDKVKGISEWDPVFIASDIDIIDGFCICSHPIVNAFFYRNRINGNVLRIGNECIKKFGTDKQVKAVNEVNRRKNVETRRKSGEPLRRFCQGCRRHNIMPDKPDFHTLCQKCWRDGKREEDIVTNECDKAFFRKCQGCSKLNIKLSEPEWKKVCLSCYRK